MRWLGPEFESSSRIPVKVSIVAHLYNPRTPVETQDMETKESTVTWPISLSYVAVNEKPCVKQNEMHRMTSEVVLWHAFTCIHTHIQSHTSYKHINTKDKIMVSFSVW